MTVTLELYHVVTLVLAIIGAFWGLAKMLVAQSQRHIDLQFKTIGDKLTSQDDSSRRIERELMELKAELPRDYVRREDHNRVVAGIQVSIDNLRLTIERALLQRGEKP